MSLTPQEIADREFLVGLRGYDKEEVRAFLAEVARAFESASAPAPVEAPAEPPAVAAVEEAAPATLDWSNVGDEIATVLRTAHEQAAALRADAERDAAEIRARAEADAEATRADAEQQHAEAGDKLAAAQTEALNLVAEAQERVGRMTETAKVKAREEAEADIADLTRQVTELTTARDSALATLEDLHSDLKATLRSNRS